MTTAALLLISCWIVSDSLWPHRLQHTRFSCPSLSPGICSSSCPLSWWCYLTISSSATLFAFCLKFFTASRFFSMSWLFTSGVQSIGASALATILPVNIQVDFPWDWLVWSPCSPRDSQQSFAAPLFESINSSAFSLFYGPTITFVHEHWKNHSFD